MFLAIKGMHHNEAKVYVLEAHAQPWISKAGFMKNLKRKMGMTLRQQKKLEIYPICSNSDCVVWDLPADDLMNPMV